MIRKLARSAHDKLKIRGWIALAAASAALIAAPGAWRSRFVTDRRAALRLRQAQAHLAAGEVDQARIDFRKALRLQPFDANARLQLASMELGAGNWELAFLEYQSVTELHPELPEGWIGLAGITAKGGLLVAPEAALDKAIALSPKRADAHALRADLRGRVGRYHGAQLDAQAAVEAAPRDPGSWALLVRATTRSQGWKAGLDAANRGIAALGQDAALIRLRDWLSSERGAATASLSTELGPAPAPSGRVRAEVQRAGDKLASLAQEHWPGRLAQVRQALEGQLRQQDWSRAAATVEGAQRAHPDSAFAPFLAGILELARGNPADAEQRLTESLSAAPRSPVVATALAKAWSREKGAAYAGERLAALAERDPGFAFARSMAARAYMDGRDPVQAEAVLRRGVQLRPDSAASYLDLADQYLELDRVADAANVCQQGLERLPEDPDLQLSLARISADLGRPAEAIRIYQGLLSRRPDLDLVEYKLAALLADGEPRSPRLLELLRDLGSDTPSDPQLLDTLGWMHDRTGDTTRGRVLLQSAVDAAPDEPGPHFHLAAIYARERKTDLARSELKAAVDSPRPFAERLEALRLLRESASTPVTRGPPAAAR
ncbi:MAG TPA: tetratricopeptide repeat protein [Myxococcales bacterium]|nr:tetratricopeptide repeat protein [Myxococcales bacterium]